MSQLAEVAQERAWHDFDPGHSIYHHSIASPHFHGASVKWIAILVAAVLILIITWLFVDPGRESNPTCELLIPKASAPPAELVASSKQFIDFEPNGKNIADGVRLLSSLASRLTDVEWPKAAHDLYLGWKKIHLTPGSQETLQIAAVALLNRFALHLEGGDLEDFIQSARGQTTYAPLIGASLEQAASNPIREYSKDRLCLLVDTCVRIGDFERAGRLLSLSHFTPDASEETRAEALRMARILESHKKAGEGRAESPLVVREWNASAQNSAAKTALVSTGMALAKSGKEKADYSALREAMVNSRLESGASSYWREVGESFVASLPKIGAYGQSDVLEAFAREYATTFNDSAFESLMWQMVADKNQEVHASEVLWRIDCLLRAARTAQDEARRLEMARRFVSELENIHQPARARQELEQLAPKIESPEGRAQVAVLFDEIGKKEKDEQILSANRRTEQKQQEIVAEVNSLKSTLAQMKSSGGAPQVIQSLEHRIKELERKRTE